MRRLDLGLGLVVFPELLEVLDELDGPLGCYEVEPQTLSLPSGDRSGAWRPAEALLRELVQRGRPILAHGVSAPVGGARPPDRPAVAAFADCVSDLGAVAATEHLSFNLAGPAQDPLPTGLFLPPCPTEEGVHRAVQGVRSHRAFLGVPFGIETGVNYLRPRPGELPDSEVVAQVAEEADCHVLLDLHNLWCNERNGREPVAEAIARLPLERVTEVHLAGGVAVGGRQIDGHCDLVPEAVLRLAEETLPSLPSVRAVVFEILPVHARALGVQRLRAHLERLAALVERARVTPVRRLPSRPGRTRSTLDVDPEDWEAALAAAATGWRIDPDVAPIEDASTPLLRLLVESGRASRIATGAARTFHLLRSKLGTSELHDILGSFFRERRPALWGLDEARTFLLWVVERRLQTPGLARYTEDLLEAVHADEREHIDALGGDLPGIENARQGLIHHA